jgi:hypothetical protein
MITITYKDLEKAVRDCRDKITSDGGNPPDGYDPTDERVFKVADACWFDGMDRMGRAILSWAEDQPDWMQHLKDEAGVCQFQFSRVMAGDSFRRLNDGDREILVKIFDWICSLNAQSAAPAVSLPEGMQPGPFSHEVAHVDGLAEVLEQNQEIDWMYGDIAVAARDIHLASSLVGEPVVQKGGFLRILGPSLVYEKPYLARVLLDEPTLYNFAVNREDLRPLPSRRYTCVCCGQRCWRSNSLEDRLLAPCCPACEDLAGNIERHEALAAEGRAVREKLNSLSSL